jgi:hypothetical protein
MEHWWNDTDRERVKCSEKIYLGATLSTANLTWTSPGMNTGLRDERRVTKLLGLEKDNRSIKFN